MSSAPGGGRIARVLAGAQARGRPLIIPYLTAGYPHPKETVGLIEAALAGGADMVEIGLPFSDPLADGPTIQAASHAALAAGATLEGAFLAAREIRSRSDAPLLFMGYYNPLMHYGLDVFVTRMAREGLDGLIVPDLPLEESEPLARAASAAGISLVSLLAPTTPEPRLGLLDAASTEFSYCVAVTGVTGARTELAKELPAYLARVRAACRKPFVVGFGISRPEQVARVAPPAAGVVVGSALIAAIAAAGTPDDRRTVVRNFVAALVHAAGAVRPASIDGTAPC